ncbi:MAG: peroxiredoxin [Methyloceanibacter sp.]
MSALNELPSDLPRPVDDRACDHLVGMVLPHVSLASTSGRSVDVGAFGARRTVIYCYPRTGVPGETLPDGWDAIPGARGCTPQSCVFRDHAADLADLGAGLFGLSTQNPGHQREMVERLHLPFEVLSDAELSLTTALRLPTFEVDDMRLIKRLTLIVKDNRIEHVFYPVFPPDENANQVVVWLRDNAPKTTGEDA